MDSLTIAEKKFEKRQWDNIETSTNPFLRKSSKFMKEAGIEIGWTGTYTKQILKTRELNFKGDLYEVYRKTFTKTFSKLLEKLNIKAFNKEYDENNDNDAKSVENNTHNNSKNKNKNIKKGNNNNKHGSGQDKKNKIAEGIINKNIDKDIKELNKITADKLLTNVSHFQLTETGLLNLVMWNIKILEHIKNLKLTKKNPPLQIYDAGLSLSRAIEYYKNIDGISIKLIQDASKVLKKLDKYICYSDLQIKNSDLITECIFDTIGYDRCLNLYTDQYYLLQNMYNNIKYNIPSFISYTTPPGSGKTTLVVALAGMVSTCTKQEKQVVYVCYNNLVRTEVSKMLFQSGTEFAIISDCICTPHFSCYDGKKVRIKGGEASNYNHNVSADKKKTKGEILKIEMSKMEKRCDTYPKVLVCDLTSTRELFKMKGAQDKYVAYIDEPTAGSENIENIMLKCYVEIMMTCPKYTVCLSATMPKITEIPIIIQHFKDEYEKINIDEETITFFNKQNQKQEKLTLKQKNNKKASAYAEINMDDNDDNDESNETNKHTNEKENTENNKFVFSLKTISVETITSTRIPINCVAIDENGFIVFPHQYVETNDDLLKIIDMIEENYFLKRFYTSHVMYDLIDKINVNYSKKIKNEYNDDKSINEYNFDNNFKTLSDINHTNIRTYCLKLLKCISEINDDELIVSLRNNTSKYSEIGFDDNTCCTTTAHLNLGSNLVIKKQPNDFLNTVDKSGFLSDAPQLKELFKNYDKVKANYEKQCSNIKKDKEIQGDDNARSLSELNAPMMEWDDKHIINSTTHIKKYTNGYDFKNDIPMLKTPFISQINEEELKLLPDKYDQALMGGVSIYDPSISLLKSYNDIYNDIAFSMADKSNLTYIVSNEAIIYGTNLPIEKVIVDDDMKLTQNMIYQLIGRAGRLGKSKSACVVFKGKEIMRLAFSFKERNVEAENINEFSKIVLHSIHEKKQGEIKNLNEKLARENLIKERMEKFEREKAQKQTIQ
jgi:energy-coupling factor transporter ATP-binding protein EcfA2